MRITNMCYDYLYLVLVTVCIFMHSVSICDKLVQLTKYLTAWVFVWYLPLVAAVILLVQMLLQYISCFQTS